MRTVPALALTASSAPVAAPKLALDRSRHAAPQVFEQLRARIVSMELAPGTVLVRSELAEAFGLSQTPIRDALMKLGEEGLVQIFAQHATVVSRIDLGAARQAHVLRLALELEIVERLAGGEADAALEARLAGALAQQRALLQHQDAHGLMPDAVYAEFIEADRSFHQAMYAALDLDALWTLVRRQSGHIDRLRRLHLPEAGKAASVLRQHEAVAEAIARRDPAAARAALRDHLSGTLGRIDEMRRLYPESVTG
ncbi:transcriptional regulator [Sphaerotilus natans subsp. natans DSM 6575]|uniref:Transcriptional regulator n=1 Tax=Sphaerotilus natans subsp. natans DSM 6575 TaxID=1286631 RepID=A0A059KIJ4_9BURK|nr:transcriptional regulator [Sphaerotilus natans subsp. natans DSM 6575]SIR79098.1 DNA-binding transcriptional regulator, GntR family [Sphaerotilus natans]